MNRAQRNVAVLAGCQALLLTGNAILIALSPLVGFALAPDKAFATLPVTSYVVATALSTVPASLWMKRVGRRAGFMTGAVIGIGAGALSSYAIYSGDFMLFCAGTGLAGLYNACGQYYRFAAVDVASDSFKSKAISFVMAGGIVGAFLGPGSAILTRDVFPEHLFLGSYMSTMIFALLAIGLLTLVDIPPPGEQERQSGGRPLATIVAQPVFLVAVLGGMIGYGVMNLVMTATPLAMTACQHPFDDTAIVIQWHIVGMFAPAFFTGSLINRFSVLKIMLCGTLLMFACVAVALSGLEFLYFWTSLVLLGLGWNFLFVGGTTLLTECYAPAEKAKVQAANDFLVFGTVAAASLTSGTLLHLIGWHAVLLGALPFLAFTGLASLWLLRRRVA
ncbi:MAG: MFS transporter [Alphaproteobacteria bacterium]|jgi:MFS family permease|nr:MFS transporter [Alphaproteobacteria bacterium]MDP7163982.1 MFS transporter [Alphaproteobacteria bacterium]MDP7428884.1 MFS transporter [Alphaproteobacteria bacterium]